MHTVYGNSGSWREALNPHSDLADHQVGCTGLCDITTGGLRMTPAPTYRSSRHPSGICLPPACAGSRHTPYLLKRLFRELRARSDPSDRQVVF